VTPHGYGVRARTDLPELLRLAASGRVGVTQPISCRYRLKQADEAFRALDGQPSFGSGDGSGEPSQQTSPTKGIDYHMLLGSG